ncbi:hypothetical protein F2Q69_00021277 [Brassica cretica]|uniref:Uncharacterized protein n=1 Tax=Brassica cretica TaxID=69181 RepID=A0A8S9QKT2_BRACR|nr:hypothetical protein F2Q69_00021277 [Brassica cretica]
MEERLEKRCDDIYFPFDVRLGGLDGYQKEVKAIQRPLASQHQISASNDRARSKSIDSTAPVTIDRHMVASNDTKSTSDDEYLIHKKIGCHQFSIETLQERLQNISNAIQKMDERWTRNDEATRSFIAAWSIMCRDETSTSIDMLTPATIDAYRCTSIDSHSGQVYLPNLLH